MSALKKLRSGMTYYSEKNIRGAPGNYNWPVSFDIHDGYVGISQCEAPPKQAMVRDRVLLTPHQVRELWAFLQRHEAK